MLTFSLNTKQYLYYILATNLIFKFWVSPGKQVCILFLAYTRI